MKRGFNIGLIILLGWITLACSNTKSYTDYLKDEKKAIDRLVDEFDFDIIDDIPENMQFGDKQFVKLESGVYMHVIDSGNGDKAEVGVTTLLTRFVAHILDRDSISSTYNNLYYNFEYDGKAIAYDPYPLDFKYGASSINSSITSEVYFQSTGLSLPMDYLGDSCIVSLIVPFAAGSYMQMDQYFAVYFEEIRYIFEK